MLNKDLIKAIETRYKGYRFRSRLEARWAVFFDSLGLEWEYEPEGFELGDGERYLPDFWIPNFCDPSGLLVEVKPQGGDFSKAARFAKAAGRYLLCAESTPDFKSYVVYDKKGIATDGQFNGNYLPGGRNESEHRLFWSPNGGPGALEESEWFHYDEGAAIRAARSARFEFGQSGASL